MWFAIRLDSESNDTNEENREYHIIFHFTLGEICLADYLLTFEDSLCDLIYKV